MSMSLNEILLNWHSFYERLSDEWLEEWLAQMSTETRKQWEEYFEQQPKERESIKWHAARSTVYGLALEQAKRLGYKPHPGIVFNIAPIVLVDLAHGCGVGQILIDKWDFNPKHREPNSMWDIMDYRRDGDAIIALIGDDRGWEQHWTYYVAIAWSPEELADEYDDLYCLI